MQDELDAYLEAAMQSPAFAAAYRRASRFTGFRLTLHMAWFRIHGYGLWLCWSRSQADLYVIRQSAHYWGWFRWKVLRPKL